MTKKLLEELATQLRRKRASLLEGVAGNQQATTQIIEERESEVEENAQKERIARLTSRLTDRDQQMIQQINAALNRIEEGTYGQCAWCESDISPARLRALPMAILCIDCATAREKRQRSISREQQTETLIVNEKELESDVDARETPE
jgi:DnaK suppressor protein